MQPHEIRNRAFNLSKPKWLTSLTVENFKAFGARQEIPLAPLTLLYGPNSAGKTSVLHALALLSQSADGTTDEPLNPFGPIVDLGGIRALLHDHDPERRLRLGFGCAAGQVDFELKATLGEHRDGCAITAMSARDAMGLGFSIRTTDQQHSGYEDYVAFRTTDAESSQALRQFLAREARLDAEAAAREGPYQSQYLALARFLEAESTAAVFHEAASATYEFRVDNLFSVGATAGGMLASQAEAFDPETYPLDSYVFEEDITSRGLVHLKAAIKDLSYLGPLRQPPGRLFTPTSRAARARTLAGEAAPWLLYTGGDERKEQVNRWLRTLEIPYEVDVQSIADAVMGTVLSLRVRDVRPHANAATKLSFDDVGFGVGQVFPVIVEGLASPAQIICVEQPEIHLHPRLQAALVDFFLQTSGAVASPELAVSAFNVLGGPRAHQWIIETHSEAMIHRIQRRIRHGQLSPQDVAILYVQNGEGGSSVQRLRLDEEGRFIDEWPDGFFEDNLKEMLA